MQAMDSAIFLPQQLEREYLVLPGEQVDLGGHVVVILRCRAPGVAVHSRAHLSASRAFS